GVQVKQLGIGANKADRIGRPRQILGAALFERSEVNRLDAQRFADDVEVVAELFAALAQYRADRLRNIPRLDGAVVLHVAERRLYPLEQAHGAISLRDHPKARG